MNKVLIVDDDQHMIRSIERLFADDDFITASAMSGLAALAAVPDFQPDLIILDIMMPGMDGYAVCEKLKSDPLTSSIMVLFLSGKGEIRDRLKGYGSNADDFITKPYDNEELLAKAGILLRLKHATDELRTMNNDLEKIVEKKTKELIVKERQALVGEMVQGIIHNYQGPLMVIGARADIATRTLKTLIETLDAGNTNQHAVVEKISYNLGVIDEAVDKLESQIKNLLAKSRFEASEDKQVFSLNDLIMKEMEFLDSDMGIKHGIKKSCKLDDALEDVYAVYSDFSQLMYNMVKNASDAMKNSQVKELIVSTNMDSKHFFIEFSDTGSGIALENLEKIFNPFFTTKHHEGSTTAESLTGTGLGLSTCVQLMKPYGGVITVQSEQGKGTVFTVTIPKMNLMPIE